MAEEESTDLLDELMSEIEEEDGAEETIPASFAMDDLTVEVDQYGDDDQIVLNSKPDIHSMISPSEIVEEEEYELSPEDIPLYVKKFEVPEPEEQEEELEKRKIELVQPNADTPDSVPTVPASEVPDTNGWAAQTMEESEILPNDFDGDGRVDEFEAAFANDGGIQTPINPTQNTPSVPIPRIKADQFQEEKASMALNEAGHSLPPSNSVSLENSEQPPSPEFQERHPFWPWHQQEEWPAPEIIKQLQASIRSAKEQNTAQATVLLDEVGPHLGNRTSLVYSVGRILMSIGRNREARQMVEAAFENHPDDPDVARAREKLIS